MNVKSVLKFLRSQVSWLKSLAAIALLAGAGYLGNYFSYPIFWGVDFLFGSIATLMVGCWYGPIAGALAAAIASSYTYQLWNHPYAIIIFTLEVTLVSWAYRRYRLDLVLLDGLYWLIPSPLLVLLFYKGVMGLAATPTQVIALKQSVNGLFNALIASALMLALSGLGRYLRQRETRSPLSLRVIFSDLLVAAVFIPTLLLIAANTSHAVADIEEAVANRLIAIGGELQVRIKTWEDNATATVQAVAAQFENATEPDELAALFAAVADSTPSLTGIAMRDRAGNPLASAGSFPEPWPPPATLSNAGDPLLWNASAASCRAGQVQLAQLTATASLPSGNTLLVVLNTAGLAEELAAKLADSEIQVVLLDRDNRTIATSLEDVPLLEPFVLHQQGDVRPLSVSSQRRLWQVLPPNSNLPLVERSRQSTYWRRLGLGDRFLQNIWVQLPAQPYIDRLQQSYVQQLGELWAIAVLALLLAAIVSRRLTRPLRELARLTVDLPEQIHQGRAVDWPQSLVAEFDALARNFQTMAASLATQFQEIQHAKEELEARVVERTRDLSTANAELEATLNQMQTMQTQLVQAEKMSSLGNLVAGVAHEINNPVNFIHGNLFHVEGYLRDLLTIVRAYQQHVPQPPEEIKALIEELDLDFIMEDCPKSLQSMHFGATRICEIVSALRNFSRIDEAELKTVDVRDGLESTLLILQNRLKPKSNYPGIDVIKNYGNLPLVECYAGHLNQVFMNILVNAIDALEERDRQRSLQEQREHPSQIAIATTYLGDRVQISIRDNGPGMNETVRSRLFDPFFTTKDIGKGTGLGMSISRQIVVEQHGGTIACHSELGQGTEFIIEIPQYQTAAPRTVAS